MKVPWPSSVAKNRCSRNKIFLKLPILSSTETYSPLNKIGCVNRQIPGDVSKTNVLKDEKNTKFLVFSTLTKWPCLFVNISKNLILRHYTLWALAIYIDCMKTKPFSYSAVHHAFINCKSLESTPANGVISQYQNQRPSLNITALSRAPLLKCDHIVNKGNCLKTCHPLRYLLTFRKWRP